MAEERPEPSNSRRGNPPLPKTSSQFSRALSATPLNIVATTGRSAGEARQRLAAANPQGRLVRPEEVAQAVVWLVRREASAMTGQAIAVAGGEVM